MSANEQMKKMLDELMGTQRDGAKDSVDKVKFSSSSVCKSYLLGLCPYDLFHNTNSFKSSKKLDLGSCNKTHDPALKADYELSGTDMHDVYQQMQLEQLRQFIADCDRKVAVHKRRLEETQDAESLGPEALAVHGLNEQIGIKLAEAEEQGKVGNVEASMQIMKDIEGLKADKKKAEDIYRSSVPPTTNQQQKLRVCEICAAFLSLYDNDRRLADHFGGRLHMGFIAVREKLTELEMAKIYQEEIAKRGNMAELLRQCRQSEREWERQQKRDLEKKRDRRSRSRDRDRRRRTRSRSRERSSRRSRSRDRRDRSRSRDRRRSREKRRSRSRSKDRHEIKKEKVESVEEGEVVDESRTV